MKIRIIFAIAVLFTTNLITRAQGPAPGRTTGHAEGIYNEYASATGGKVSFNIQTLSQGPLSDLAGRPFSAFLVAPTYRVESDLDGTELTNVGFIDSVESDWEHQEFNSLPDQFQDVGLPLQMGVYRRLGITATIGADSRSYESMEFCWASLSQCKMLDPVVVFLQSKVENRMRLIADGWGPKVTVTRASNVVGATGGAIVASGPSAAATSSCGLLSDLSVKSKTKTWPAHDVFYRDTMGNVVVQKNLGQQSVTISCDASCHPHVTASSSVSGFRVFSGWKAVCGNTPNSAVGTTGLNAAGVAETKCTHNPPGGATPKASVSISSAGTASVNRTWSLVGTADTNGGRYADTCSTAN
jgi:hypothetical protein